MSPPDTRYVQDDRALAQVVDYLAAQPWFALDTEFERNRTYYPRLCLLQVATPEWVGCIDPLAVEEFDTLRTLADDPAILKVVHAGTQDCEVLFQRWGATPGPLFDTQIAAPLLGFPDQLGYAALVEQMLGVSLPKSHTRTDWCRRPLSDAQLRYAEDDARYLAALYPLLRDRLLERDCLHWLAADFADLSDDASYRNPPVEAWRRLRRLERLKPGQLAAAQALAQWRETTAQAKDLPRAWLLRDDALLELAREMPGDMAALRSLGTLDKRLISRHGEALLSVIANARERTPEPLPDARGAPLNASEAAALAQLQERVADQAARLGIDPALLASRKKLVRIVRGAPRSDVFRGWRLAALEPVLA